MPDEEESRAALDRIARRLGDVDPEQWAQHAVERSVSVRVRDLGLAYASRLHAGGLDPFTPTGEPGAAQVRIAVDSGDLVALADDRLSPARAWATGKLKIEARFTDLLRLRKIL
ncbi:SCP2 sterol-binding domain-containing protein [Actinomadura flavalba]|uniref:SCP2 sterol-binding domain-containing protein n=1 Tax=Actinomadura flavalba TaxID=1120938 RepID=UPI000381F286|nr:SCP2 sterol-binding domain-containing protein [Actinomadura flavalba]